MAYVKPYNPKVNIEKKKVKKDILLYIFLIPLVLTVLLALITRDIPAFGLNLVAFLLFYGTAKLNSLGLTNEFKYHKESFTKAPKKPFKTMAALLLGVSTLFTTSFAGGESLLSGVFLGVTLLWFGSTNR